jgi:hypothetical protein
LLPTPAQRDWKGANPNRYKGHDLPGALLGDLAQVSKAGWQLLPTPTANDDNKSPEAHMRMKARMPDGPRKRITSLAVLARAEFRQPLLPTPGAWLGRRPENAMADPEREASRDHWGTRGKRSWELPDALESLSLGASTSQPFAAGKTSSGGLRLNPSFVEWMMGLPQGWSNPALPLSAMEFSCRLAGSAGPC